MQVALHAAAHLHETGGRGANGGATTQPRKKTPESDLVDLVVNRKCKIFSSNTHIVYYLKKNGISIKLLFFF